MRHGREGACFGSVCSHSREEGGAIPGIESAWGERRGGEGRGGGGGLRVISEPRKVAVVSYHGRWSL
jgi:hypothetical protein